MVLSSFLLLSFFLFLLVWSFFYLFSFWFFFLEFFLLCVRFPLSLFSYEKCFCAHVQTWPRRYRDHADHEPDDPGPGWEVRNEDSIVIVAQGGDNGSVVSNITSALEALLGIPVHKIKVLKMS